MRRLIARSWFLTFTLLGLPAAAQEGDAAAPPRAASLEVAQVEVGAPARLMVWNREVAVLRAQLGRLTSAQRAKLAVDRILTLPDTALYSPVVPEAVQIGTIEGVHFSVAGKSLFTLFTLDLDPTADGSLEVAAERAQGRLAEVLRARGDQRKLPLILRGVGLTGAATLALAALLWLTALLKRSAMRRIRTRAARSERLRVRGYDLRPHVADLLERLCGLLQFVVTAAGLYGWLTYCLALFPYTAPWGERLGGWLVGLLKGVLLAVVGAVPNLVIVAIIFFLTRGIARMVRLIILRVERRAERQEGVAPESVRATRRLVVVVVWIFGIVVAYPYLPGSGSDAFKGISVLIGLMVSLGSTGFINQVMSGFVVLYSRSVRSGEVVRIGDVEGQVTDISFLCTRVLQPTGDEVSIPNAVVISRELTNFSRHPGGGRAVAWTSVTIGYDTPWRQVRALLLLAAERTAGIVRDPAPRVAQRSLADWYVEYVLVVEVEDGKRRAAVLSQLHAAIQDAFNEFGVQIMSPHFVAQPSGPVVVPPGKESPDPAPRFARKAESAPAAFDPVERSRAERAAAQKERADRARTERTEEEREPGDG